MSNHIRECSVEIANTSNHREYLSQHPECDFTANAQQFQGMTLVTSKQTKQIELHELTEKIQALETQNAKWQRALERADINIEQKRATIDSPEAETEFRELMVRWQQRIVARQLAIENNTAAIRELSHMRQQVSSEIEGLDKKLTEFTQPDQNSEKSVSDKRNTVKMVQRYKKSIPREKINPNQHPLHDTSIKPNSNSQ